MSNQTNRLGEAGESIAARYLQEKGLQIIARNFRDKSGEIDIIAEDDETLVFIEVKTRQSYRCGFPEESVTRRKQKQIIRLAEIYLARNSLVDVPVRFDVIAIHMSSKTPEIEHISDAFEAY